MAPSARTIDLLTRLIGFDTTSHVSNLTLIRFVADELKRHGIESRLVPSADGQKASLFATIGPAVPGGVVLSGHTDVVPVKDQIWATDPFTLAFKDGRYYGRGTCDMKGFIAVVLALVPDFAALKLAVPIHLAFSYDEEVGCLAAKPLIERIKRELPRPAAAIIGEPTEMKVVNAHRGIATFTTRVRGKAGHSSVPDRGANAIAMAAECIGFLGKLAADAKIHARSDSPFDPPHTTISVGHIEGGSAVNIIAGQCTFEWDLRAAPGLTPDEAKTKLAAFAETEVLSRVRAAAPEASIETVIGADVPPLLPKADSPALALALALTGQNRPTSAPFTSEAGMFQDADIPSIVCGPGSAREAHQPNEFVAANELILCEDVLRRLGKWATQARPQS